MTFFLLLIPAILAYLIDFCFFGLVLYILVGRKVGPFKAVLLFIIIMAAYDFLFVPLLFYSNLDISINNPQVKELLNIYYPIHINELIWPGITDVLWTVIGGVIRFQVGRYLYNKLGLQKPGAETTDAHA